MLKRRVFLIAVVLLLVAPSPGSGGERPPEPHKDKSIPAIVARLQEARGGVRLHAVYDLLDLGDLTAHAAKLVPVLMKALGDSEAGVRGVSTRALAKIGKPAVGAPIEALAGGNEQVRYRAAETLGLIGPDAAGAVPALIKALADKSATVRMHAARSLGRIGPGARDAVPALIKSLGGKAVVWYKAVRSLGQIGKPAVPHLLEAFKAWEGDVGSRAALALCYIGPPAKEKAAPVMKAALRHRDIRVRIAAAEALAKVDPTAVAGATKVLMRALESENQHRRREAVYALGHIGPAAGPAAERLVELLDGASMWTQVSIADALGSIGAETGGAGRAMQRLLGDKNNRVRSAAAQALGKLRPTRAAVADMLIARFDEEKDAGARSGLWRGLAAMGEVARPRAIAALDSAKGWKRTYLLGALRKMGPPAVPALLAALKEGKPGGRMGAAAVLGRLGEVKGVIPALVEALGDKDRRVRSRTEDAFSMIGPPALPLLEKAAAGKGDRAASAKRALYRINHSWKNPRRRGRYYQKFFRQRTGR